MQSLTVLFSEYLRQVPEPRCHEFFRYEDFFDLQNESYQFYTTLDNGPVSNGNPFLVVGINQVQYTAHRPIADYVRRFLQVYFHANIAFMRETVEEIIEQVEEKIKLVFTSCRGRIGFSFQIGVGYWFWFTVQTRLADKVDFEMLCHYDPNQLYTPLFSTL